MDIRVKRIRQENRNITLVLMPLVMIAAKIIHLCILPDKYYFDSWRMLSMLTGGNTMVAWTGYQDTVDFYKAINIFHFTTLTQWSVAMGILMTPIIMFMISKTKEMELRECIFVLMATGILNIYVFSITKETIQLLFFILIYVIICLPIKNTFVKVIGCAAVFYWESTFYRGYYIIMAIMSIFVYFIFVWLKRKLVIKKKDVLLSLVLCFVAVFLFMYASKFISPEDFKGAINVRDNSANEYANTVILNPIKVNDNLGIFMFDYVIAAIRMMLPLELLIKSPIYAPFVVYQGFILYYFIKTLVNIKEISTEMLVVISCFSAYLFGSFIFEPDFGSWVRHEAATFPILQMMALGSKTNTYSDIKMRGYI